MKITYVRVNGKWNYVCLILDLHNREIIGYSAGPKKDARLVYKAFATIKTNLNKISVFHTDRGNEFKNNVIEGILDTFNIAKTFKIEFVYPNYFESLDQLQIELFDHVNWYNNIRLHSSLGYVSPVTYKNSNLKKNV